MNVSIKTTLGIVAVLITVLGLAGYFVLLPQLEKRQAENIADFLQKLPGNIQAKKISVSFLDKSFTIVGLAGTTEAFGTRNVSFAVDSLAATGANFSAANSQGVAHVLDTLVISGLTMHGETQSENPEAILQDDFTIANLAYQNIRGDVVRLVTAVQEGMSSEKWEGALASFFAEESSGSNYSYTLTSAAGIMQKTVKSVMQKKFSLLNSGETQTADIRVSWNGSEVFTSERMSFAGLRMPAGLYDFLDTEWDETACLKLLDKMWQTGSLELKDLVLENIVMRFDATIAPVTVQKVGLDLSLRNKGAIMKKDFEHLVLPVELYRLLSPETAQFAAAYAKPLDVSGGTNITISQKDGLFDAAIRDTRLEDKELGGLAFEALLLFKNNLMMPELASDDAPLLRKGKLVFEDKLLLENFLAGEMQSMRQFGIVPEGMETVLAMREFYASQILQHVDQLPLPAVKPVLEGVSKLFKAPGTLSIEFSPEEPVELLSVAGLTPTVKFLPAQ